jgi:hypothetical protein
MISHQSYDFSAFSSLLDAQPEPVRTMFQYCLALAMVEMGKGRLAGKIPGESGPICTFETAEGEMFCLERPPMSEEQEERVIEELRKILRDTLV